MSTSLSLNSRDTVGVTTFFGGNNRGTCYQFHFEFSGRVSGFRVNVELTEDQLFEALMNSKGTFSADTTGTIAYDNRGQTDDPELQKLLDEEEEIARQTAATRDELENLRDRVVSSKSSSERR